MIYGRALLRPAVADVRAMLHQIKLDNMERAKKIANERSERVANFEARIDFTQTPFSIANAEL